MHKKQSFKHQLRKDKLEGQTFLTCSEHLIHFFITSQSKTRLGAVEVYFSYFMNY